MIKTEKNKLIYAGLKIAIISVLAIVTVTACTQKTAESDDAERRESESEGGLSPVILTENQFNKLGIKTDTVSKHLFSEIVTANGSLEVLPENEASVTAVIGANVSSIKVFEGKEVDKGDVLAYLSHPDLLDVQTQYLEAWNKLQYLGKEYARQKKLFKQHIASGKNFQKISSEYHSLVGRVKSYAARLRLLKLDPGKIIDGVIYEKVPVISPIDGFVEKVNVKTGQYVEPALQMFEIVNNKKIHADLMVFEKDAHKVKVGQKVTFSVESVPGKILTAKIFSVGKAFEQNPKAVHIHAEIDNKKGLLISGMYISGKIYTSENYLYAIPEDAIVTDEEREIAFVAKRTKEGWKFDPVEIVPGRREEGYIEIKTPLPFNKKALMAMNNAYYLLSEMKKYETGEE